MDSTILGYRLYADTSNDVMNNYLALFISIVTGKPSGEALAQMHIAPMQKEKAYANAQYKTVGEAVYILETFTGMQRKDIAMLLDISGNVLRDSLHYIGCWKDRRFRK